jgi:hypothetical protein
MSMVVVVIKHYRDSFDSKAVGFLENALWLIGVMHHQICTVGCHWDLSRPNVLMTYILLESVVSCTYVLNPKY